MRIFGGAQSDTEQSAVRLEHSILSPRALLLFSASDQLTLQKFEAEAASTLAISFWPPAPNICEQWVYTLFHGIGVQRLSILQSPHQLQDKGAWAGAEKHKGLEARNPLMTEMPFYQPSCQS